MCNLGENTWSTCYSITCVLSSVITPLKPQENADESFVCFSYTASSNLQQMASLDLGSLNLGIPAYSLQNNMLSRFTWADTLNAGNLVKTLIIQPGYFRASSLQGCMNICKQKSGCKYGHYEPATYGYGNCYLTGSEVRTLQSGVMQLTTSNPCTTCVVFWKIS